jgi:hypothetical protein
MMTADMLTRMSATQIFGATISLAVIAVSIAVIVLMFVSGWRETRPPRQ